MDSLVRPDPTAKSCSDDADAGAGASLYSSWQSAPCSTLKGKGDKLELSVQEPLTNLLPCGLHGFEDVIKYDASADCESVFLRIDMDISEEAKIDTDGSFQGACSIGVSTAAPSGEEGNTRLRSVVDLEAITSSQQMGLSPIDVGGNRQSS